MFVLYLRVLLFATWNNNKQMSNFTQNKLLSKGMLNCCYCFKSLVKPLSRCLCLPYSQTIAHPMQPFSIRPNIWMATTENEHNALFQNKFITSVKTLIHSPSPHFPNLWLLLVDRHDCCSRVFGKNSIMLKNVFLKS